MLAPELRTLMTNIGAADPSASKAGIPALISFLHGSVPWLTRLKPYFGGLVPVIDYINDYRRELAGFFANSSATTEATALNATQATRAYHYLRISNPINPELLTAYAGRLYSNRSNPYMAPGGYGQLTSGLRVFGSYLCTGNPLPTIGPTLSPAQLRRRNCVNPCATASSTTTQPTPGGPPCKAQAPLGSVTTGQIQTFPHLHLQRTCC